jgi:hypothetical protein
MRNNFIQEAIRKENVHLTMKVGQCEVRGVLHEILHVLGLVKTSFWSTKLLLKI